MICGDPDTSRGRNRKPSRRSTNSQTKRWKDGVSPARCLPKGRSTYAVPLSSSILFFLDFRPLLLATGPFIGHSIHSRFWCSYNQPNGLGSADFYSASRRVDKNVTKYTISNFKSSLDLRASTGAADMTVSTPLSDAFRLKSIERFCPDVNQPFGFAVRHRKTIWEFCLIRY